MLTRGGGRLPAEDDRHGVIVHRVREPRSRRTSSAFVRWVDAMNADMHELGAELCERFEFDLVHSHDWLVAGAAERSRGRIERRWLTTVHATEFGRHQGWVQKHPQSHIHAVERAMVRRADHVITCSQYMRGHVATVFGDPPVEITAIPNGIDPRDLEPVDADLPGAARALRRARRAARAARRPARLREGLPPRARRARAGHPPARRRALRGRRHRHRRGRAQAPGAAPRPDRRTARSSAGSATTCSTRSTASPTSASCRRSTSRSGSSRSRRWRPAACASSPTPAACARSCPRTARSGCASPRATRPRWRGVLERVLTDDARAAQPSRRGAREHVLRVRLGRGRRGRRPRRGLVTRGA